MNETTADKPAAGKPAPKQKNLVEKYFEDLHGDGKLTRIPVKHLYFVEAVDFNGVGDSQASNRPCVRVNPEEPATMRRTWVCDFIPAWQVFEITFVPASDAMPITELLPAVHVRRWKRA